MFTGFYARDAPPSGILDAATIAAQGLPTDSLTPQLTISAGILSAVATLIVLFRLYGRAVILRVVGWDDYCVIIAAVLALGLTGTMFASAHYGLGQHAWMVGYANIEMILKYGYPLHILYILSLGFSRSSLLLQLIRLAPTPRLRKAFWFLFGFSTCFTLAAFLSHALICKTKPYLFWESKDPTADVRTGRCISYGTLQLVMGVINIFTDFVVWLSPLQIIYSVRLPRSQKVGLFIVFAFGGLVWISAIVRLYYARVAAKMISENITVDPTYRALPIALWSNIETHIAIICCSIPTLRPFLRRLLPASIIPTSSSRSRSRYRANDQSYPYELEGVEQFKKLKPDNTAGTSRERVVDV
ncbi:hypothetical protein BZA05DRAFT_433680 [Tricharina praecox]|uniref:uncharacterized protein n=1 Tax=Tricharina praecox TaxID=43433 RepID=UPI002220DAC6|nr:uncharacterized protein BZA05DRAFT_433680 [Tricharina praecox]KAI5857007.1 hypothetical protein BZA05DRAFT_433680 [Tricharina praecox]